MRLTGAGSLLLGVSALLGAERFRISGGDAIMDFTSTTAFRVAQTGGGNVSFQVDSTDMADTETAVLVRLNDAGARTTERVTIGAVDSGGLGFRLLRVPN